MSDNFAKVMDIRTLHQHIAPVAKAAKPVERPIISTDIEIAQLHQEIRKLAKRDHDANRRFKAHVLFISLSIIFATFPVLMPMLVPLAGLLAGAPGIGQEINDWVHGW